MYNSAQQLFFTIQEKIVEELENITPEQRDVILAELEEDTDDCVLGFDLAHIMENI